VSGAFDLSGLPDYVAGSDAWFAEQRRRRGMGAELAARRTAAGAVLADYWRAANQNDPGFSWAMWAGRLAASLGLLLDATSDDLVIDRSKVASQIARAE
jgi:hypothetical protein